MHRNGLMNELKASTLPPNSPDLNPIKHLWYILDHIQPMDAPCGNPQDSKWYPQLVLKSKLFQEIPQMLNQIRIRKFGGWVDALSSFFTFLRPVLDSSCSLEGPIVLLWGSLPLGEPLLVGQCLGEWSSHECKEPSVSQQNISLQEDGQSCWFLSSVVLMLWLIRGYFVLFCIMNVFLAHKISHEKQTWSQWDCLNKGLNKTVSPYLINDTVFGFWIVGWKKEACYG